MKINNCTFEKRKNIDMNKIIALFLISILMFSACKTTKDLKEEESMVELKEKEFWSAEKILEHVFTYTTFQGKADIHLKTKDLDQNATLNLRMQKDKKIWTSIVAMGIAEVGRALVSPDSIQALTRLDRNAFVLSFSETKEKLNLPLEFEHIENLLLGNPIFTDGEIKNRKVDGVLSIFDLDKEDYVQTVYFDQSKKVIKKITLKNSKEKFFAEINLDNYENIGSNQMLALDKNISIKNDNTEIAVTLRFKSHNLNIPIETPFSIPKTYTIKNKL